MLTKPTTLFPESRSLSSSAFVVKSIAIFSSFLSVIYTVLLAKGAFADVFEGSGAFWSSVLAVGLALCFEGAKYGFLYAGVDTLKPESQNRTLRAIGASMVTLSIVISIISIAASRQYIENNSEAVEVAARKRAAQITSAAAAAESDSIRAFRESIALIDQKLDGAAEREKVLLSEQQELVGKGYYTRASQVAEQIKKHSSEFRELLGKKESYLEKISQERESAARKASRELLGGSGHSEGSGEEGASRKYSSFIIAVLLEVISLLSVFAGRAFRKEAPPAPRPVSAPAPRPAARPSGELELAEQVAKRARREGKKVTFIYTRQVLGCSSEKASRINKLAKPLVYDN